MYKVGYKNKEGDFIILKHIETKKEIINFMYKNPQYDIEIREITKGKYHLKRKH